MVRSPPEYGAPRDLRIDFFRGLALYMIIFDHIAGDPFSKLTYARLGFSDAAEIFVFLSGVSCGIAYSRLLTRQGISGLLNGVFWRALQIYAYYLIVSLITILLITVSRDIIAIPDNHQDYIALTEDPLAAIQSAFFLVSPPDLPGVLVLYLELTLFFIPMFILIAAWNSAVALLVSGSLWLLAQIYPDLLAGLPIHSFFNPMAWQFIFCIGMYVGTWYNSDEISLETFRKRPWVLLACAVVGIGLLYKLARLFANNQLLDLGTLTMSDTALAQMKAKLSAIRLMHFFAVAFLVAICVKPSSPILNRPGASVLIKSGRASLQVFCLGAVLTVILNLLVAVERPGGIGRVLLDSAAILLIAWVATTLIPLRPGHPPALTLR